MWSACHKKSDLTNLEVRNLKSEISCLCPVTTLKTKSKQMFAKKFVDSEFEIGGTV